MGVDEDRKVTAVFGVWGFCDFGKSDVNRVGTQISKTEGVEEVQERRIGGPFKNLDVSLFSNSSSLADDSLVCLWTLV